ncbi:transcriptional regulator [Oryzomicrobium sp.]|nr:transcriptional regulator [Oryzomicrobium sp.]
MTLRELRTMKRLRQSEVAELLGYEQTYISALEIGIKGPPPEVFLERVVRALDLDESWKNRLREAHDASQRRIVIPADAPESVFWMVNELRQQIDRLHPAQIELIRAALNFTQAITVEPVPIGRLRRRASDKSRKGKN